MKIEDAAPVRLSKQSGELTSQSMTVSWAKQSWPILQSLDWFPGETAAKVSMINDIESSEVSMNSTVCQGWIRILRSRRETVKSEDPGALELRLKVSGWGKSGAGIICI